MGDRRAPSKRDIEKMFTRPYEVFNRRPLWQDKAAVSIRVKSNRLSICSARQIYRSLLSRNAWGVAGAPLLRSTANTRFAIIGVDAARGTRVEPKNVGNSRGVGQSCASCKTCTRPYGDFEDFQDSPRRQDCFWRRIPQVLSHRLNTSEALRFFQAMLGLSCILQSPFQLLPYSFRFTRNLFEFGFHFGQFILDDIP